MRITSGNRVSSVLIASALMLSLVLPSALASQSNSVRNVLPQFEAEVLKALKTSGAPGLAIAIVHRDEVIYLKGFGVREEGKAALVDADTVFQLASVSKSIASTVVAGLVGDGVVKWDDPIVKHDPAFRLADPWVSEQVTILDLFSHRSGLPDHAGDVLEDIGYDRAAVLHRLRYQTLERSLRSAYFYTNFGLTEAAIAAARASGKSWEDISSERLYRRIGMNNTSSRYADFQRAGNRALGHVQVDGKWVAKYQRNPDAQSPAGGVSSSVRDMANWVRLQLADGKFNGQQIIAASALAETHRPHVVSRAPNDPSKERAEFYGLGWIVSYDDRGRVKLSHSGAFSLGASTNVTLMPSEQLGIVILCNFQPRGVPEALARIFLDLVQDGKVERDWMTLFGGAFRDMFKPDYGTAVDYNNPPAQRSGGLPLDRYVGTYRNDFGGDVEVVGRGGGLAVLLGPARTEFPLKHYDRDVFSYQPVGENAYGPSGVAFTIGWNGKATSMLIEFLNLTGEGAFRKVEAK